MNRRDALRNMALLVGGGIAAPSLLSILQSCTRVDRLSWEPQFLTDEQALFISEFVDTLLPATDTPGALDVNVDIFIDRFFENAYDEDAQQQTRINIDELNAGAVAGYGDTFVNLNSEDRKSYLSDRESESGTFRKSVWGTPVGDQNEPPGFYKSLKSLALWAYFSSETVGEEVLGYDPVPGIYKGCIPLSDVGKSWSL